MDIGPEVRVIQVEEPTADIVTESDEEPAEDHGVEAERIPGRPTPTDRIQQGLSLTRELR
jgi:hypothetical protein